MKTLFGAALLLVAVTAWGPGSIAEAASVSLGSDYLTTLPGTFFDFPGIGPVELEGRPVGPGNTDTIVQRLEDAILPAVGSSATIPIELVALSLQSVDPVDIGGTFFDVFVHLTPGTSSLGEMTINHEFPDNATPAPEGTFTSFIDMFFTVELTPTGGGVTQSMDLMSRLETVVPGLWSHEFDPGPPPPVLVSGLPGDQAANLHSPLPPGFGDFFILGVDEAHVNFAGLHRAGPAQVVPQPSTLLLLGSGLAGLAGMTWRGHRQRCPR